MSTLEPITDLPARLADGDVVIAVHLDVREIAARIRATREPAAAIAVPRALEAIEQTARTHGIDPDDLVITPYGQPTVVDGLTLQLAYAARYTTRTREGMQP